MTSNRNHQLSAEQYINGTTKPDDMDTQVALMEGDVPSGNITSHLNARTVPTGGDASSTDTTLPTDEQVRVYVTPLGTTVESDST